MSQVCFYSLLALLFISNLFSTVKCDNTGKFSKQSIRSVDVYKTEVFGPGLQPDKIVLPVRFFYILPRDAYGFRFNASLPEKFVVDIYGDSPLGQCRVRVEQIDRGDGSVIVRYKMVQKCTNVQIHVQYKGKHVAKSPYRIYGTIFSDKCYCPQQIDHWLSNHQCNSTYEQIEIDLKPFNALNFTAVLPKILKKYDMPGSVSLCHYVIKNNEIYRKCNGQHTGFKMFSDAVLEALVRLAQLPDVEFLMNLGDWPLVKKGGIARTHGPYPIFSWCGSEDSFDIVLPTYDLTESTLEAMNRVTIDILSVQRSRKPWNEKESIAFWRGRDARRERLTLVDIAREYPDMFNVSLTNFFFFRDEEAKYGPKVPHMSFFEFFDYKYQLNIDGTVAAYRFPYLLASNSVVFKQDSPFYEHFYRQLEPMHHYIPFKRDLSDLVDKIKWAKANDDSVKKISEQAQNFVNDNLTPDKVLCYHVQLLKEWSKKLINKIEVQSGMEKLPGTNDDHSCECEPHHSNLIRDEL